MYAIFASRGLKSVLQIVVLTLQIIPKYLQKKLDIFGIDRTMLGCCGWHPEIYLLRLQYFLNGSLLYRAIEIKDLGFLCTPSLSFRSHIECNNYFFIRPS